MTAPLFLVPADRLAAARPGSALVVDGDEGRHAVAVRRIQVGELVLVADGEGRIADTEVEAVRAGELSVRVLRVRTEPPPCPRFVLVQALAKADRDEQAVEAATEVGVDEVVAWQAARSVVVWRGERGERSRRRWELLVRAAAKQSRRSRIPAVRGPVGRDELAALLGEASLALVLHEEAGDALSMVELPPEGDVVLVVGPEGGVSAAELAAFEAVGARTVRLGPNVLRSSTAGPAALALLSGAGRWR